jgi:putative heme-binding domain-containing protein
MAADVGHGRSLFVQKCAQCHRLFGEGAAIGPELTGAQRTSVDYLLQNIVDPSAAVPREYRVHTVVTKDGRLLNGVVPEETTRTVTLQSPTERIVLDRGEIDEMKPTSVSMMPEGLLDALTAEERRDLIAYLSAPGPLPAGQ